MPDTTDNKVKYNLRNAYYAMLKSIAEDGTPSYDTPVALPGAVSISLDPNGAPENFYADGIAYYICNNNQGYSGDFELAMIPDAFLQAAEGQVLDADKVATESSDAQLKPFALLFEFDGDVKKIKHVLYNCTASRPKVEGATNEDKIKVQTDKLTINATPLPNRLVKGKTTAETTETVSTNWYKSVHLPTTTATTTTTP